MSMVRTTLMNYIYGFKSQKLNSLSPKRYLNIGYISCQDFHPFFFPSSCSSFLKPIIYFIYLSSIYWTSLYIYIYTYLYLLKKKNHDLRIYDNDPTTYCLKLLSQMWCGRVTILSWKSLSPCMNTFDHFCFGYTHIYNNINKKSKKATKSPQKTSRKPRKNTARHSNLRSIDSSLLSFTLFIHSLFILAI